MFFGHLRSPMALRTRYSARKKCYLWLWALTDGMAPEFAMEKRDLRSVTWAMVLAGYVLSAHRWFDWEWNYFGLNARTDGIAPELSMEGCDLRSAV
jgi:hypothetical protein